MSSINQHERNSMVVTNVITGKTTELPSFTCSECGRAVILNPNRQRPRNTCRQCNALTCDACRGIHNPILHDSERALRDEFGQPWMLRGLRADGRDAGEPVLYVDGVLALAKDVGYTDRMLARQQRSD